MPPTTEAVASSELEERFMRLVEADQRRFGRVMGRGQPLVQPHRTGGAVLEDEVGKGAADIKADPPGLLPLRVRHSFLLLSCSSPAPRSQWQTARREPTPYLEHDALSS